MDDAQQPMDDLGIPDFILEQYQEDLSGKNGPRAQIAAIQELTLSSIQEKFDLFTVTGPGGQALSGKWPFFTTNSPVSKRASAALAIPEIAATDNEVFPWYPRLDSGTDITISTGVLNGDLFPTNASSVFTLSTGTNYAYLKVNLVSGVITSCEYHISTTPVTNPTPAANTHPTAVYQLLFNIDVAAGAVDFTTHVQHVWGALSLVKSQESISGSAPSFGITYNLRFLRAG